MVIGTSVPNLFAVFCLGMQCSSQVFLFITVKIQYINNLTLVSDWYSVLANKGLKGRVQSKINLGLSQTRQEADRMDRLRVLLAECSEPDGNIRVRASMDQYQFN